MVNDAYCRTFKYEREEILGQHYSVVLLPGHLHAAEGQYAQLLDGDMSIPIERKWRRKDGTVIDVEAVSALLVQEDGERLVISVVRDITERKRTEQAVHHLYEQTAQDAKTKTMLLREVNHRVKNNTIKYATSGGTTTDMGVQMAYEGDNTLLLEIRDSGPGYPPDALSLERHGVRSLPGPYIGGPCTGWFCAVGQR